MAELQHWLDGVGPLARHGATALMAVAGVALWLLGRSMARPLGAFIGLLAGATAAMAVPMERYGPLAIIIGSFVGCITAWLQFRIWTGAEAATVAAFRRWLEGIGQDLEEAMPGQVAPRVAAWWNSFFHIFHPIIVKRYRFLFAQRNCIEHP